MAIDKTVNPYYDDFDEFKNYHQILFKPGYSIQARELTQIQSVLKNQIAKFGNHVFKNGSVVIPGNTFADLSASYIKLETQYSGVNINTDNFQDMVIVGETSGVKAQVKIIADATETDPITFYIIYLSGGNDKKVVFDAGEIIHVDGAIGTKATIKSGVGSTGIGSIAYVNRGVYYVNGTFVSVDAQYAIISKYSGAPNCRVLFKINEEIIDITNDTTILDPAQGSNNYAAPGADRLKISLELTSLPLSAIITDDYIELMRYRDGVLEEHARSPKYNELDKALAQRTYDESGNYVVAGLNVEVREHKKVKNNGGVYAAGDKDKIVYDIEGGKAYVKGFPVEKLSRTYLEAPKARTTSHVKQDKVTVKGSYGQSILITQLVGFIATNTRQQVLLYSRSGNTGGTQIGTATAFAIDYHAGDGGSSPIYKLYLTNISLTDSYTYEQIGGIRTAGGAYAKVVHEYQLLLTSGTFSYNEVITVSGVSTRTATVSHFSPNDGLLYLHRHDDTKSMPISGDALVGGTSTANANVQKKQIIFTSNTTAHIFNLPTIATKALKNDTNAYDMDYSVFYVTTIASGASTTATLSPGTFAPIDAGTFAAYNSSGIMSRSSFSLNGAGTQIIYSGTAPVGGITIYTQVNYNGSSPRTKDPQTFTDSIAAASVVTLTKADVYEITSITAGGLDVTSLYSLETGQTDTSYELSSIVLRPGYSVPSGTLSISYKYFLHSPGDYFSIDSYNSLPDYQDVIPVYKSKSNNQIYDLKDCIDFRKTAGMTNNPLVVDSIIDTSVQRYMPRIDSVCMNSDGEFSVISGDPADIPRLPNIPPNLFEIQRFGVIAYTRRINDITTKRVATSRYTMNDISKLGDRIKRLEDYTTLTTYENELMNKPVLDSVTGLDRFKTGLLVEDFTNPFTIGRFLSSDNRVTLSSNGIQASNESEEISITFDPTTSSGFNYNNGFITLPYTEVKFIEVGVASRITNINPFQVISWKGSMKLTPPGVYWTEVVDSPEIFNEITRNETVYTYVTIPYTPPPPPPPPPVVTVCTFPNQPILSATAIAGGTAGNYSTGFVPVEVDTIISQGNGNFRVSFVYEDTEGNRRTSDYRDISSPGFLQGLVSYDDFVDPVTGLSVNSAARL